MTLKWHSMLRCSWFYNLHLCMIKHFRFKTVLKSSGKSEIESIVKEIVGTLLNKANINSTSNDCEPIYVALRLLYNTNESGLDSNMELLQAELLLRQHQHILNHTSLSFIRTVMFTSNDFSLRRRVSGFISLNPTLLDVCQHVPELSDAFLAFFNRRIVQNGGLEEAFQSTLANCLKRIAQKNKVLTAEELMKYIMCVDSEHMGQDVKASLQNSLVYFLEQTPNQPNSNLYRLCLASLLDPHNPTLLADALKDLRQNKRAATSLVDHLDTSFEQFLIAALFDTLDTGTSFIEDVLHTGLELLRKKEYEKVRSIFGDTPLKKLKPLLLAMIWDEVDSHHDQAVLLEELCYNVTPNEKLVRAIFSSVRDQVDVGKWCEEHVKPLLKDSWNSAAAASVTSSQSKLQVILLLNCIEKLGQSKVLRLMFNVKDNSDTTDANDLPLSDSQTIDQGKDIVTFCSAMVVINVVLWLQNRSCREGDSEETSEELDLAEKHLSRVFPLNNRAEVLSAAFSALVHALKQPKCGITLQDCEELVYWLRKQLSQFENDQTALSMGHFDTVKIFRDLSYDAQDHKAMYERLKTAVEEAEWRIGLLKTLTETKSRKRREIKRQASSHLLSFMCSTQLDLMRLCLISENTERASETIRRYGMSTTHLAKVVDFQNDYTTCIKELERFGAAIKKQQQAAKPVISVPQMMSGAQSSAQGSQSGSSKVRSQSMSSTSSSITSTVSAVSRVPSMSNMPVSLRNVANAVRSGENVRVPAIVGKLISMLTMDQLMIECETHDIDNETLIARLLADMACSISAPKSVGLQLMSLALERIKNNVVPDSSIETYMRKLHEILKMLDSKPYPGITVATSSPREYLNSIYPCISHDVFKDLLEFNENQAVAYRDLKNAINDKGPLDEVRMEGALEAAKDALSLNNYTTFLSTHDKHREYFDNLISYLKGYKENFNISLEDTPFQVYFSPSSIFEKSPQYHLGELILKEDIHPKMLAEGAEYVSVDLLQLVVMSSFPQVCLEEPADNIPPSSSVNIHTPGESDGENAAIIINKLHEICSDLPEPKQLPLHVLMTYLENCQVSFKNETTSGSDLIRLLTCSISYHKQISALKPSDFSPLYLLGLLPQKCRVELTGENLEEQVRSDCMFWLGTNAYISADNELHLTLHPLNQVANIILKQTRKGRRYLLEFYNLYTEVVLELLGGEIETIMGCNKGDLVVREDDRVFYLTSKDTRIKIVTASTFDFKSTTTCSKCKDIDERLLYRADLKPMTPGFDFVNGHSPCLAALGYMFNALDNRELYGAGLLIDDTLLDYPALQKYVALRAGPYIQTVDTQFVNLMRNSCRRDEFRQDVLGCQLFGGPNTRFLAHLLSCMVEYNLKLDRQAEVYEILSSDAAREIYGKKIPDLILLLTLDKLSPVAPNFLSLILKIEDKLLGLEFARERYQTWPVNIATECFTYFNEVFAEEPDCISMILSCLERLSTMSRISKILNYLEINLNTCLSIEDFVMKRSEDFTQLMTTKKEFAVCHSVIKLGILTGDYEAKLLAEHVLFMAQNDNFDTLDIYNLLENKLSLEVCNTLCSLIQQHTNNLKIVLQLIDIILDKFQPLLSREKTITLKQQRLGAQCFREIKSRKVANYEEYSQLLFKPLILLEQLIMNFQIHTASELVAKHSKQLTECGLTSSLDALIKLYIGKSLYYEGTGSSKTSDTTTSSTVYSTMTRTTSRSRKGPTTVFNPPFKGTASKISRSLSRKISREEQKFQIPTSPAQWVDEKKIKRCQICKLKFTFIIRKHHCRWCGRVLCDKCAPVRAPTSYFGASVRLCWGCFGALQEGRYSEGADGDLTEDIATLYNPPFEVLSIDPEDNEDTRESFFFTTAPSSELCLYLSRMLSQSSPPGDVLLPLCESLSETIMESVLLDPERNFSHIFGVLENVLKEARNCFRLRGISSKVEETNIYIAYTQICRRLPLIDLSGMPAMKSLLKPDTLHNTYMSLLDKQYPQMAISLCTTARKDPLGLWRRWGFQCLRAGDYPAARDKLEMCLKSKQYNQAILDDIINHLENCLPSFLAETVDFTELVDNIKKKCRKHRLNSAEFDECVYYLSTYSTPVRLLQFFIRHDTIGRAAQQALQLDHITVYEGVVRPLIKTGRLSDLFDYINTNRGQIQTWERKLTDCCKLLSETGDLASVYSVQFFLREFLNAAKTAILMLRNEVSVKEQLKYLDKAEDCFKSYLEQKDGDERALPEINTRISHIHLQRQILEFLQSKQMKDNNNNIHIFSSKTDRSAVVMELYKIDPVECIPIVRTVRDTFSLSYIETYLPLVKKLLKAQPLGNVSSWFPKLIKILGEIPDDQKDELLLNVCWDVKGEQKSFERILATMRDDRSKIRANVNAGYLKNAYILAVNKKMRDEIVLLEEECVKQGNTQVREFCKKYLQHNKPTS